MDYTNIQDIVNRTGWYSFIIKKDIQYLVNRNSEMRLLTRHTFGDEANLFLPDLRVEDMRIKKAEESG